MKGEHHQKGGLKKASFFVFYLFEQLAVIGKDQNKCLAKKVATSHLLDKFPIISCEHGSETF
jgi:hypothetical protein